MLSLEQDIIRRSELHVREDRGVRRRLVNGGSALLLAIAAMLAGCAFPSPPGRAAADMTALGIENKPYHIRVGDKLSVRFYKTPELNIEEVPVRSDGKISLDLIGDIQAAGIGTDELSDNLARAYSKELQEPRIAVIVRSFGGQVFVGGEVNKPASLAFSEGLTALQAIQGAGGFNDMASIENVVLVRRAGDHYEGYRLFLKKALSGEDYTQNVALEPNDIVYVPKSRIANLNLIVLQYISKMIPQVPIGLPVF
jgi:protein involved in polysaccharide export with SLBB domain